MSDLPAAWCSRAVSCWHPPLSVCPTALRPAAAEEGRVLAGLRAAWPLLVLSPREGPRRGVLAGGPGPGEAAGADAPSQVLLPDPLGEHQQLGNVSR